MTWERGRLMTPLTRGIRGLIRPEWLGCAILERTLLPLRARMTALLGPVILNHQRSLLTAAPSSISLDPMLSADSLQWSP